MWPFKKTESFGKLEVMRGMTDWHSHILPAVDDGIPSIDKSLELLSRYEDLGVEEAWLTPHIMDEYPNTTAGLNERFQELKNEYKGSVKLNLAAENMIDSLFEKRLEENDFLPIGEAGMHLLVETSTFNPPMNFWNLLVDIKRKGYIPLLAHPERYSYMKESDYMRLVEMGVMLQMNLFSLVGGYGDVVKAKAEWLLGKDMIDVVGTDVHRLSFVEKMLENSPGKKEYTRLVRQIMERPSRI